MFLFSGLQSFLPKINATVIDNEVFRLHYKFTVVILVAFLILATSREYIGEPIACQYSDDKIPSNVFNQYCWIQSTYSMKATLTASRKDGIAHPGLGVDTDEHSETNKVRHKYYQWVAFVLFLQAVMFYVPRYFWKMWEGGKMKAILMELNRPIIEEKDKTSKLELLQEYFTTNLHKQNNYFYKYFACETLNLVNVIGQLYFTDRFLGWEFMSYGVRVLEFVSMNYEDRFDPMIHVFPRVTKCTYHKSGPSGGLDKIEGMCILPLNVVNEKIFIFIWFLFIVLLIITIINLIYRIVVCKFPVLRSLLLRMRAPLVSMSTITRISEKCLIGDWYVLYLLSKNMDSTIYRRFVIDLEDKLHSKHPMTYSGKEQML